MKKVLIAGLLIAGFALYSCGGSNSNKDNENDVTSNAESSPSASEGQATPPSNAAASGAASASNIDVNAPSDDKGVGKFTNETIKMGPVDAAMAAKGKQLFQTSCTACHTPTDQKLIGPGLKNITKIRTPNWILNMITDPAKMTASDPIAKELLSQMNGVQMTNQNVGDDGARAILEFLRQNDGAK